MDKPSKQLLPDPDLQALIRKLNRAAKDEPVATPEPTGETPTARPAAPVAGPAPRWPLPVGDEDGDTWLSHLLGQAREAAASDLVLVPGAPPTVRVNGRLAALGGKPLSDRASAALAAALVLQPRRDRAQSAGTVDFSFSRPGLGRFRCNVHRQRGAWAAAIRLFPDTPPDLEALNLPPALGEFAELEHGLVLVTGPTGSGKSTTLAALIRRILARRRVHLITIEDPVEYEHTHTDSVVEHIEIGRDIPSYADALRAALRQDPDVLLIGEMRDPESISIAITAAETGHVVLSTLHTGDAPQTVHRILDSYPANQIDAVRTQLSVSLAGIVSQQLLPRLDGKGRVPAAEILMATHAVRNLIRQGKVEMIRSQITLERHEGMLSLDRSLAMLAAEGRVEVAEAKARARVPSEFDMLLARLGPG